MENDEADGPRILIGSETVISIDDELFKSLRKALKIPTNFLEDNFDFTKLAASGGKGGNLMARSPCKKCVISRHKSVPNSIEPTSA